MPRDYTGEIMPQYNKPDEKIRLFHGTKNKITNGVVEARYIPNERMGFEDDGGGIHAAFATSDIHMAADYAGPTGHIYEVHEKPNQLNTDFSGKSADIAFSEGSPLHIKQEVGRPGVNLARRSHFNTGHEESRK